jgi:hypothetical protein
MITKGGRRKAEGGAKLRRSLCARTSPLPPSPLRPALTLIELLVAISIIATLSAMFLGASRAAMEHSRGARTRTTIDKLHTLIMERYADYETRRVELDFVPPTAEATADYRLLALRELMKFEMPDRWSDVTGVQPGDPPLAENNASLCVVMKNLPTLAKIYRRRYDPTRTTEPHESAECLYMIVIYACGDGESRSMFSAQDIGDFDGDGAPEFLDGWGRPIGFLRWPAGFVKHSDLMSGDAQNDHDPFDPFRRDLDSSVGDYTAPANLVPYLERLRDHDYSKAAFRLVPLIYSAGPDEESEIDSKADLPTSDPTGTVRLDPYAIESDETFAFGTVEDFNSDGTDNSLDNIHNHLDTTR